MTWETRAGGVLAKTGHKLAFSVDTRGERLFDSYTLKPKPKIG